MPILQWLTREQDIRAAGKAPFRLLEEAGQYGDPAAQNMLIQGDNLEALKALLPYYAGKVKCIYIDPPYNTQSAFKDYDDSLLQDRNSITTPRPKLSNLTLKANIWSTAP